MKLTELFACSSHTLSCEVFPPKTSDKYDSVKEETERIAALSPAFMSVTCGAGGSAEGFTVSIAANLRDKFDVVPLVHLTCVGTSRESIRQSLRDIGAAGIKNILALRGDMPAYEGAVVHRDFNHASELVAEIKRSGDFCVGGACYPEGHPESPNLDDDITNLAKKVDAGCDFLTTQMFFDNNIYYSFIEKLASRGINVPVIPGIMPVTNARQVRRIFELSGKALPRRFAKIVEKFGEDDLSMKQAGVAYATEQIIDLYATGVKNVHLYTMNNHDVAARVIDNISAIISR